MKKSQVPEGSIRVKCDFCKKYHIVAMGEWYACPKSCESGYGGHYIAVDKNGEVKQTKNFENVKIWLGLKL